jgi:hypothetical protein
MLSAMNKMVKKQDFTALIKDKTDWQPLLGAIGRASKKFVELVEEYGSHGVYQVIHKKDLTDNLIDANIGYIGKSTNIFGRVYDIKTNQHNCCNYIKRNNLDRADVYVRYLFTEVGDETTLEDALHSEMNSQYGYRFAWREASAGNDGAMLRLYEAIDKIDNMDELKGIAKYVEDKAVSLFLETWKD